MDSMKKKTPKYGMAPIDEILKAWCRKARATRHAGSALHEDWRSAVGEEIARRTRVIDCAAGELVVEVDSAPLLNELSTYCREQILESLRGLESFRGIQKLRFRAASFAGNGGAADADVATPADAPPGAAGTAARGGKGRRERHSTE